MTEHTPGPWCDEVTDDGDICVVIGSKAHQRIWIGDIEDTCGECRANARLIAAAPELLVACEAARELIGRLDVQAPSNGMIVYESLGAAIAKAKP